MHFICNFGLRRERRIEKGEQEVEVMVAAQ